MPGIMLWSIDDGLHYAEPEELRIEAAALARRAGRLNRRNERERRDMVMARAKRYKAEADKLEEDEE